MSKLKPTDWAIMWSEPYAHDDTPYYASYDYKEGGNSHTVTNNFKTYQSAYAWLAENIEL